MILNLIDKEVSVIEFDFATIPELPSVLFAIPNALLVVVDVSDTEELTFNIPNLTNRFLEGNGSGYIEAGLPNITGQVSAGNAWGKYGSFLNPSGAFTVGDNGSACDVGASGNVPRTTYFNASRSSSIYGKSSTVQPSATKAYMIIKY